MEINKPYLVQFLSAERLDPYLAAAHGDLGGASELYSPERDRPNLSHGSSFQAVWR